LNNKFVNLVFVDSGLILTATSHFTSHFRCVQGTETTTVVNTYDYGWETNTIITTVEYTCQVWSTASYSLAMQVGGWLAYKCEMNVM